MPYNSFQKLSTSKLSGVDSILPAQPTIFSGFSTQTYATRSGFNRVTLGVRPSGGLGTSQHSRLAVYRSTDGGANYSYYSGILLGATGIGYNFTDTGLTTGTTYFYKFGFSGSIGGVSYETTGSGFGISTKTPIIATGGDFVFGHNNLWGQFTNNRWNKSHIYKKSANFVVANAGSGLDPQEKLHVFIVGGGGGGGKNYGGGGGGGGVSHVTGLTVSSNTTYTITVGAGGAEKVGGGTAVGNNGGHSSAFNYTGYGGGAGGGKGYNGNSGGCGGGAGWDDTANDALAGGSGLSGSNVTGLTQLGNYPTGATGTFRFQGFSGGRTYYYGAGGGGGGTFESGGSLGTSQYNSNRMAGGAGLELGDFYGGSFTNSTLYYRWVKVSLNSGDQGLNYVSPGGGGGGSYDGAGGNNIAGDGSNAWGEDYYSYPAGLGGSGTWYGAGGGGGGKGGGGGGAGYSGVVVICYITGDYLYPEY